MTGAARRGILGAVSWVLLAGALIMMWLVLLAGTTDHTPLNRIWFLRADTAGIDGARAQSQWTYWYVCGAGNRDCGAPIPALPIGKAWNEGGQGAPTDLVGSHGGGTTSKYYYYMWRFGWVFYLMAFVFANLAILSGVLSCIRIIAGATGILALMATFWMTLSVCLMTAVFVKARDKFNNDGRNSKVGSYAFGFTWASLVLLFLSSCLFLGGAFIGKKKRDTTGTYSKEGAYVSNGNTGYPPGNQGFATENVQSGYTGNAPPQSTNIIQEEQIPSTRGAGRRGLFPRHREASAV